MMDVERLRRGVQSPNLILRKLNIAYHRRLGTLDYNTAGVDIFREDWDTLVILDACRYDLFTDCWSRPEPVERRISRGSSTTEFLRGNFANRDLSDTVYVTANPQLYRFRQSIPVNLHHIVNVWIEEGWHEEQGTVLPETVARYARQAAADHPQKRLVVHFLQPHYPFIDSETTFDKGHLENPDEKRAFWDHLMSGGLQVDVDTIWDAYEKNLLDALPVVDDLVNQLDGLTVITSDHGNMIGERSFPVPIREWGHPRGVYTTELVEVPWVEIMSGPRRETIAEDAQSECDSVDEDVVRDRLQQLGYTE